MAVVQGVFRVAFNANGGTGGPGSQQNTYSGNSGSMYSFTLRSERPTRSGYYFRGWATSSGGSAAYQPGGTYSFLIRENMMNPFQITLYAVWTRQSRLNFVGQGATSGVPESIAYYINTTANLPNTIPVRAGYMFKGWNTAANGSGTMYQPGGSVKWSTGGDWYLYAIWQINASTLSVGNGVMGSPMTIGINKANSSCAHTIKYSFGAASGVLATKTTAESIEWTPPESLATQTPNAVSGTLTFTAETYDENTLIGSTNKSVSLAVPNTMVPTIELVTMEEATTGIAEQFGGFVQGKSKIRVRTQAGGIMGSTIARVDVSINGQTISGADVITDEIRNAGSNAASVIVTDTRGRSSRWDGSYTAYAYTAPTITVLDVERGDTLTTAIMQYQFNIEPIDQKNTKTIRFLYKLIGAEYWSTAGTVTLDAYSGSGEYTYTGLSEGLGYDLRVQISDFFTQDVIYDVLLAPSDTFEIDVHPEDGTIAFHREAPGDGKDHWGEKDVVFEKSVEVEEGLKVEGYSFTPIVTQFQCGGGFSYTANGCSITTVGRVVVLEINIGISSATQSGWQEIAVIPCPPPKRSQMVRIESQSSTRFLLFRVSGNGQNAILGIYDYSAGTVPLGVFYGQIIFIV